VIVSPLPMLQIHRLFQAAQPCSDRNIGSVSHC
jgi:hypothetical protein